MASSQHLSAPTPGELGRLRAAFRDVRRLRQLQDEIDRCAANPMPSARILGGWAPRAVRALAVVSGSFNPLTRAHLALAEAAERETLGMVAFLLATRIVDKERIEGALLVDRLLTLLLHLERAPQRLAILANRGLFVEQAALLRVHFPELERLTFVVGFDKIVQILDPRYYADREAALEQLFELAFFVVAPRSGDGPEALARLLEQDQNRAYARKIRPLSIPAELAEVASSRLRLELGRGATASLDLPLESLALVEATGCYRARQSGPGGSYYASYAEARRELLG
jgi:nicotinamide-nucleotide adenylyltransferase